MPEPKLNPLARNGECKTRCVDTCTMTGRRECGIALAHRDAIKNGEYITMVTDTEFTDGSLGPCYALVGSSGCATAVTIKRAIELQEIGYPFSQPHPVYPDDFTTFFGPDFGPVGGNTIKAFTERTPESINGEA